MPARIDQRLLTPFSNLLVALQALLILTGGAVRLTGSGLGCPTWPECTDGSIAPVATQPEGATHSWIEFGNRLLTFALFFAALAVLILVIRSGRKDLRLLAASQIAGIFGQAILGGITVLTHLNPISVASHFILSIALLAAAISLQVRVQSEIKDFSSASISARVHLIFGIAVIALGTLVTGSGPHAGDAQAPRLHLKIHTIASIHGAAVAIFIAFTAYLFFASKSPLTKKWLSLLLVIALFQGLLGIVQYLQGVPQLLVALHLLGSSLTWLATWRVWLSNRYVLSAPQLR